MVQLYVPLIMFLQVLGLEPYDKSCYLTTDDLCADIFTLFKFDSTDEQKIIYTRHLALPVSAIVTCMCSTVIYSHLIAKIHGFHNKARKWIIKEFGPEPVSISEEEWATILEEDKQHP